jgi:hypothetical protein
MLGGPMDKPLQALLISGEKAKQDVISGKLNCSIRIGFRGYTQSGILIGCHILGWCVMKKVNEIEYYILKDMPLCYIQQAGHKNKKELFQYLKGIYPTITENSEVTFVGWE